MAYDRLVLLEDVSRKFTAKAAGTISGGDLVQWSSGTDCVGSVATTYAAGDISVITASGNTTNGYSLCGIVGVAEYTVTSGQLVSVFMDATVVLPVGSGGVSGGLPVQFAGYSNMVEKVVTGSVADSSIPIGRALTAGTNQANFCIVKLSV